MDDELILYKTIFEERKPESENLVDLVKDRNAIGLLRDLVFQCETYSGQYIHSLAGQKI